MSFFAIDNFKKIYSVLHSYFQDKYKLDIDLLSAGVVDVKKMVYAVMRRVNADTHSSPSVSDKNKVVLRECKEVLLGVYVKLREQADAKRAAEQQRIVASTRVTPDAPGYYSQGDVDRQYADISASRQAEQQQQMSQQVSSVGNPGKSEAPYRANTTSQDVAFSNDEFTQKLQILEKQRAGDAASAPMPYKMDDGSNIMRPFAANNGDTSLFSSVDRQSAIQRSAGGSGGEPIQSNQSMADFAISTPAKKKHVNLLMCSTDRDFVAYPLKSLFKVRFGKPTWQNVITRVLTNNQTIPGTRTAHYDGVPNMTGFYLKGTQLAAYNPTVPPPQPLLPSDIITELSVSMPSDHNASVQTILEDVVALGVEDLVVPYRSSCQDSPSPALTIFVPEIDGDLDGTGDPNYRGLCSLTINRILATGSNGVYHVVYKPAMQQHHVFEVAQNMRYLTFHIRDCTGQPWYDAPDGAVVASIDSTGAGFVTVTLTAPASNYDIEAGDRVRFTELVVYALTAADTNDLVSTANTIFANTGGYMVSAVSGSSVTVQSTAVTAQVSTYINRFGTSIPSLKYVNGYVINLSKQLTLNVKAVMSTRPNTAIMI